MTALISVTIKIALLTLVTLVTTAALRRQSAAVRHWLIATSLACCVCLPALEFATPYWTIPVPSSWWSPATASTLQLVSEPAASSVTQVSRGEDRDPMTTSAQPSLPAMLASIWLAGTVMGLGVLVLGLLRLRSLASNSEVVSSGTWHESAENIARAYGVGRPVRLLYCRHPTMLATWGVRRPTILLPSGAESWPADRIRAVLHHELAHILRADWAAAIVGHVLRALYWFNPLLWIACRRLRHESERACDDLVLTSGMSGTEYATHLLDVAREAAQRQHPWSPAIAIAHRSMLEGRVRAMLNARVNRQPLTVFARTASLAVSATVTAFIGIVSVSGSTNAPAAQDVHLTGPGTLPVLPAIPERAPASRTERAPAQAAAAQSAGGTIEGVLYDPFGGLLPGVSLKLTAVGTSGATNAFTDRGGAFSFKGLATGDYELVTDLPGFTSVKNVIRAESGATVRRHITLPIGTVRETIVVTCGPSDVSPSRPTAPSASSTPGTASRTRSSLSGTEPKIPSTFTGGIGGQIKAPMKVSDTHPACPTGVVPESTVVQLAGRIGIDGLFTDLHDVSADAQPVYVASALDAARKWVFTPTLLNGAPIEANITVTIHYNPTRF